MELLNDLLDTLSGEIGVFTIVIVGLLGMFLFLTTYLDRWVYPGDLPGPLRPHRRRSHGAGIEFPANRRR